jgi:hypothetical protein
VTARAASRGRLALAGAVVAASWLVYAYGAWHSPLLDSQLAAQQAYLTQVLRGASIDMVEEQRQADLYWSRYPDVANDRYFGRDGAMGVRGAREHFERHGRREGRIWGDAPAPAAK